MSRLHSRGRATRNVAQSRRRGHLLPGTTTPLAKSGTNAVLSDDECIAIGEQALGAREAGIAHSTPVATRVYGQAEGTNSVEVASAPIGEKSDVLLMK